MDAKTYQEAIEYELLTKAVYQGLLDEQYPGTITVQNNIDIVGRSGVAQPQRLAGRLSTCEIAPNTDPTHDDT